MKVIKVENQIEGGKVAFEILKEKLANGAQTLGTCNRKQSTWILQGNCWERPWFFKSNQCQPRWVCRAWLGTTHSLIVYFMQENLFNQKPFKESFLLVGLRTMLKLKLNATTKFWLTIQLTSKFWESVAMVISDLMNPVLHLTVKLTL